MSKLTDRLERDLREIAAGAQPSPSAWHSIEARLDDGTEPEPALVLAPARSTHKRPVWPAVAAAILLVILVSIAMLARAGEDDASFADDLTSTFVSPRNGFSIKHPDGAAVAPAEQSWGLSARVDEGFDVVETGSAAIFRGTTASEFDEFPCFLGAEPTLETIPCGSIDEQVDQYLAQDYLQFDGCGVPRSQQADIAIDGQSGRVAECPNHIEATVVTGGRLYLFTLSHDRDDARAVFDAFAATIDLTPETAVDFAAMTTTFVSPTYGLSFNHFDRNGDTPATEPWDPASHQDAPAVRAVRFDEVETGSGAVFAAASTKIPAGVSIDAWVDEYVTPRAADGCGVPRSTQEEITIDGQSGRTTECRWVEATVVAGGRLYLFMMFHQRSDARAWFDAWIATVDLTPETATAP